MRLYNAEDDKTFTEATVYLTTSELAQLYGLLGSMLQDIRVKEVSVADESFRHTLKVMRYSTAESVGFDRRQKLIVEQDC